MLACYKMAGSSVLWELNSAPLLPGAFPHSIQKGTSTDPGSAKGKPSPATSARWGIASLRRVAGKISILAARWMAFGLTLHLHPDDIYRQAIGVRRD